MTSRATPRVPLDVHQHTLLDVTGYNRHPELTEQEREALARAVACCTGDNRTKLPPELNIKLARLLEPINDILTFLGSPLKSCSAPVQVLLQEMQTRSTPYWSWSEAVWTALLTSAFARFRQDYSLQTYRRVRFQLMVMAYIMGPQTDFFLPLLGEISPLALACRLFGEEPLQRNIERVRQVLSGWGYGYEDTSNQRCLTTTVAEVALVNRSVRLEQMTFAKLSSLRQRMKPYQRGSLERLSKVLAHLAIIERPLPPFSETLRVLPEQTDTSGIAPEWVEGCLQWHRFSDLAPLVKRQYLHLLLRAGRWLAELHPEVTSPHQWTAKLAAEYVAVVCQMKAGDFSPAGSRSRMKERVGTPLSAGTKEKQLVAMRTFFREIQDEPHNVPRRFDPMRAFRTPHTIKKHIGPNPRDLDPFLWAKLVHAALNLTQKDLPQGSKGVIQYPLALVRAVAVVWVYSGLRADEIVRLRAGCVRWQREDVTISETGEVLPREAVCFLTVPVNKTTTTFQKPVNPVVGRRINEWEQVRAASQPHRTDRKTGAQVNYLFLHRGHPLSLSYLNTSLIPTLCKVAGIPRADERGAITSHRARATLATLLYNAPAGLSLFELMQWLGHTNPASTQQYVRVKPTKLAASYSKAEHNSRLVEALVETKADANGAVNIYYVLGEHGLCGNPDWASCLSRMACIKCPFFVPKNQAHLIEACQTVKRFMEVVELTDEELAAVQDDYAKLEAAVQRRQHLAMPTTLRRRAKGAKSRGIPLVVLRGTAGKEPGHNTLRPASSQERFDRAPSK
jgi:integrase